MDCRAKKRRHFFLIIIRQVLSLLLLLFNDLYFFFLSFASVLPDLAGKLTGTGFFFLPAGKS